MSGVSPRLTSPKGAGRHEVAVPSNARDGAKPHTFQRVAFHSPCTLQHGQKIVGVVESLLTRAGFELTPVADGHMCCGSAGTYSVLQPEIAGQLRQNKLAALGAGKPALIASANIGCITHLQETSEIPVRHWVELINERLREPA